MHRVVEKMGATELRKKYDLLPLDFCRLAGGAVDELFEVDILLKIEVWAKKQKIFQSGLKK